MKSENETAKDAKAKAQDKLQDDSAPKAAKPPEDERELTDDEIAAVAGGNGPRFPMPT